MHKYGERDRDRDSQPETDRERELCLHAPVLLPRCDIGPRPICNGGKSLFLRISYFRLLFLDEGKEDEALPIQTPFGVWNALMSSLYTAYRRSSLSEKIAKHKTAQAIIG